MPASVCVCVCDICEFLLASETGNQFYLFRHWKHQRITSMASLADISALSKGGKKKKQFGTFVSRASYQIDSLTYLHDVQNIIYLSEQRRIQTCGPRDVGRTTLQSLFRSIQKRPAQIRFRVSFVYFFFCVDNTEG